MKTILLACLMIGCSSPEPVGETSQAWFNDCPVTYNIPNTYTCTTLSWHVCKDGAKGFTQEKALAANYIGTECFQNGSQTYFYVCGINSENEAWVYCNYPGDTE